MRSLIICTCLTLFIKVHLWAPSIKKFSPHTSRLVSEQVFCGQWKQTKKAFTFRGDSNWLGFNKVSFRIYHNSSILHNFVNFINQRCTCRFTYVASKFSLFLGTWVIMLGALLMDARAFLRRQYGNQNEEEIWNIRKWNRSRIYYLHQSWPTSTIVSNIVPFDGKSLVSLNLFCWQCHGKDVLGGWCDSGSIFVADVVAR